MIYGMAHYSTRHGTGPRTRRQTSHRHLTARSVIGDRMIDPCSKVVYENPPLAFVGHDYPGPLDDPIR